MMSFGALLSFHTSLGRDSTGWVRLGKNISTPGTLLVLGGGSGFEIFLSEAGGGFLGVCGRCLGPSRGSTTIG
jgi:hypothetical protein